MKKAVWLGAWVFFATAMTASAQLPPLTAAQSPLAPTDALAASVEVRVRTLASARDLNVDAMQRMAAEVEARVSTLEDYAAPYPSLAEVMPAMRVQVSALLHDAGLGTTSDVESDADGLLTQVEDFRNRVRNLAPP